MIASTILVGLLGCLAPQAQTTAEPLRAEKRPAEEDLLALARRLEQSIAAGDLACFESVFDVRFVFDRMEDALGVELDADFKQGLIGGALSSNKSGRLTGRWLTDNVAAGGNMTFLRVRAVGGERRLLYRLLDEDDWLDYVEFVVERDEHERVRIVDLREWTAGVDLSEVMLPIVELGLKNGDELSAMEPLDEFNRLLVEERAEEAWSFFLGMDEQLRNTRGLLGGALWLGLALGIDEFQQAVELYRKTFPADPALDVFLINCSYELSTYEEARQRVERLQRATGGDAFLEFELGDVHRHHGKVELAKAAYGRAIEQEPTLESPYFRLVRFALEGEQFEEVARLLTALAERCGVELDWVADAEVYAPFVESAAGRRWLAARASAR